MSKSDFTIKFRGTRGSYPVTKSEFLEFGGNTASTEVRCGKQLIILDAGTGIIDAGNKEIKKITPKKPHRATILLSHIHQDHIQGLQFYKPLFIKNSIINLFGLNTDEENLKDTLKTILFDRVFPLGIEEINSSFNINNFSKDDIIVISQDGIIKKYNTKQKFNTKKDDIIISAYKITSHPKYGCLSIKIKYKSKILIYATDRERLNDVDKDFILFAKDCDCLIHDAQYVKKDYKEGFGHSTFEMAIQTAKEVNAKRLFFFHYDPEYNDTKLKKLEEKYLKSNKNTSFAKENYEIQL